MQYYCCLNCFLGNPILISIKSLNIIDIICKQRISGFDVTGLHPILTSDYHSLQVELQKLEASLAPRIYYKNQVLCQSLGGNNINLLTITNENSARSGDIAQRPYIVLTCRVHPGESNSSWIMKGNYHRYVSRIF